MISWISKKIIKYTGSLLKWHPYNIWYMYEYEKALRNLKPREIANMSELTKTNF